MVFFGFGYFNLEVFEWLVYKVSYKLIGVWGLGERLDLEFD